MTELDLRELALKIHKVLIKDIPPNKQKDCYLLFYENGHVVEKYVNGKFVKVRRK